MKWKADSYIIVTVINFVSAFALIVPLIDPCIIAQCDISDFSGLFLGKNN